jgi:hypothetical protein
MRQILLNSNLCKSIWKNGIPSLSKTQSLGIAAVIKVAYMKYLINPGTPSVTKNGDLPQKTGGNLQSILT